MNLAVFGSSGYLGSEFVREAVRRSYDVRRYSHEGSLGQLSGFDFVINFAALVSTPSVDGNEDQKADTLLGNLVLPSQLVSLCETFGIPMLQVSTGCLFNDSNKNGWIYGEEASPELTVDAGAGIYVASKELAERVVSRYSRHYICRVRLPFDNLDNPRNLLTKLDTYPKICDERQSVTHREDFVDACLDLIEKRAPFGTYNMTSPGAVKYRDVCCRMNQKLHAGNKRYDFWDMEEFDKTVARTPKSRCELSTEKLRNAGVKMRPAWEAIEDSLDRWEWSRK